MTVDIKASRLLRTLFLCLLPIPLLVSCAGISPPVQHESSGEGPSYCAVLEIPPATYPPRKPVPFLGITHAPVRLGQEAGECRDRYFVQVGDVIDGTPAQRAGLREDDVIVAFNGETFCRDRELLVPAFKGLIEKEAVGNRVSLGIKRGEEMQVLEAVLGERPYHRQEAALHPEAPECPGTSSVLMQSLSDRGYLPAIYDILEGLDRKSDEVINPAWLSEGRFNLFQMKELTYLLRNPFRGGLIAEELGRDLSGLMKQEQWRIGDLINRVSRLMDLEPPVTSPEPAAFTLDGLLEAVGIVREHLALVLQEVSPEDRSMVLEMAADSPDEKPWNALLALSFRIDRGRLLAAFSPLLPYLSRDGIAMLRSDVLRRFGGTTGPVLYDAVTPAGRLIIGGEGRNTYREDAAIILDLGGDDVYLNNAGGTRRDIPVALVIDWGGDDLYLSREDFSQGAGLFGGGFLLDLSGSDVFSALDNGQGAGTFGVGLLYHDGEGLFAGRKRAQGVGLMGMGLLWSRDGNSQYTCAFEGQGLGLPGGAGGLIDMSGDDSYQLGGLVADFRDPARSTDSMGQGFGKGVRPAKGRHGAPGGVGLLFDLAGDDTYVADYFAQGAAYFYGLGILQDLSGNDRYAGGRYVQGAGVHTAVGILADRAGDDRYSASFGVGQGLGHDYAVGSLEDAGGDDRYEGGILVQGAATTGGIGLLWDRAGSDDSWCREQGQAFAPDAACAGILIDTDQRDDSMNQHHDHSVVRLGVREAP